MFVTMLALPALLLRNMATLDLGNIEWDFFLAILAGKSLLFFCVLTLVLLKSGCTKRGMSDAGIFAIFVTQSNDFAMGLPILTALFEETQPTYPKLLYVIAPISLIFLNPIGMVFMEYGREPSKPVEASSTSSSNLPSTSVSSALTETSPASSTHNNERPSKKNSKRVNSCPDADPAVRAIMEADSSSDDDDDDDSDSDELHLVMAQDGHALTIERRSASPMPGGVVVGSSPPISSTFEPTLPQKVSNEKPSSFIKMLGGIMWRVLKNPVVTCSMLGILFNLALDGKVPVQIDGFLLALGNTFSALALFILGVNMNGKLVMFQDRRKLFGPLLMILAKCVALPITIRLFIGALGVDGLSDLTMCAFLVGTLPPAPSVPFFAQEFGAHSVDIIGPSMVLGTFIAAPIMFISAQMVTVAMDIDSTNTLVSDSSRIAAGFGFVGAIYCIICFVYNRRWRSTRERLLLTLLGFQALNSLSVQFCVLTLPPFGEVVIFWLVLGTTYGLYLTTAAMAINEIVRRYHGYKAETKIYRWYNIIILTLVFVLVGSLQLFGRRETPTLKFEECWTRYGNGQWIMTMTLICISFLVIVFGIVQLPRIQLLEPKTKEEFDTSVSISLSISSSNPTNIRPHSSKDAVGISNNTLKQNLLDGYEIDPHEEEEENVNRPSSDTPSHQSQSPPPRFAVSASAFDPFNISSPNSPFDDASIEPDTSILIPSYGEGGSNIGGTGTLTSTSNLEDPLQSPCPIIRARASANGQSTSSSAQSSSCPYARSNNGRQRTTQCEVENFWLFAMKLQLFLSAASLFLYGALECWSNDTNGIRIEMVLLDKVLFSGMGMYTLALFAFSTNIISPLRPLKRVLKRWLLKQTTKRRKKKQLQQQQQRQQQQQKQQQQQQQKQDTTTSNDSLDAHDTKVHIRRTHVSHVHDSHRAGSSSSASASGSARPPSPSRGSSSSSSS